MKIYFDIEITISEKLNLTQKCCFALVGERDQYLGSNDETTKAMYNYLISVGSVPVEYTVYVVLIYF